MNVVTGTEINAIEQYAAIEFGFPLIALMERAGYETAVAVKHNFAGDVSGKIIHIVCGGGSNGGDGFVAARHLHHWGAKVKVWTMKDPANLTGDAAVYARVLSHMRVEWSLIRDDKPQIFRLALKTSDLVVDALIGTGLKVPLRPAYAQAIRAINQAGRPVISVDIPSGVDADTGRVTGGAVRADVTLTFSAPKVGHLLLSGRYHTGRLMVVDIGLPQSLFEKVNPPKKWVRSRWAQDQIKPRLRSAHKGSFGRLLVVAGSVGMAGAAALTAQGALRAGVGLVQCFVPSSILPVIQQLVPEATGYPLPEIHGHISSEALEIVKAHIRPKDVIALGPGLGQSETLNRFVARMVTEMEAPLVIDADALNALAQLGKLGKPEPLSAYARIMTPHPKEAARLLKAKVQQVSDDPMGACQRLAEEWSAVCVLKGSTTLIKQPKGTLYFNESGDVALATGGSGDVLTGVIAGLLAQGYEPDLAAALGTYVHGRAGELVAQHIGRYGSTAQDVAFYISKTFLELERGTHLHESIPPDVC